MNIKYYQDILIAKGNDATIISEEDYDQEEYYRGRASAFFEVARLFPMMVLLEEKPTVEYHPEEDSMCSDPDCFCH